jgi:hypothetical protein
MLTYKLALASLILPLVLVAGFGWGWWSSLARPWLFAILGLGALYAGLIALLIQVLSRTGIAGTSEPSPPIGPVELALLWHLAGFLIAGSVTLWLLKLAFAK